MSENYLINEVQITLRPGVVITAQVDTLEAVEKLMKDLQNRKLVETAATQKKGPPPEQPSTTAESPEHKIELGANLPEGALSKSDIMGFKDNVPELINTSGLSVTDAVLILLLAMEMGLRKSKIDYDSFKALYDAQNIKSGSPLAMKLTDLRNNSYVDKKLYADEKCLRLTAKGQKKAIEALKARLK